MSLELFTLSLYYFHHNTSKRFRIQVNGDSEKIRQVTLMGIQNRLITLLFSKIHQNFCLLLKSRLAWRIPTKQNKHCVFQSAVDPNTGLISSPCECRLGWQHLFLERGSKQLPTFLLWL